MDFPQIIYYRLSFLNLGFCTILTVFVLLTTILCWSVAIGFFTTFSLKVIYVRFIDLGYTVLKRMPNIKITTKK